MVEQNKKILYVMRGISGSGKSTLAQQLGKGGVVYGSDEFFYDNKGNYNFDPNKTGEYHQRNYERALEAMKRGITPIVIDNTNIEAWQPKPYVVAAKMFGYKVEIRESETPWKFDAEELTKRNRHSVPREVIDDMLKRWHHNLTVDDILNAKEPEPEQQT